MNSSISRENFVEIVNQFQGIINNLCCVYYPNRDDQHDARQDIILQLWKSFPSFKQEAKISTWIYRVGLNTILAKRRKEKRIPQRQSIDDVVCANQLSSPYADDDLQQLKTLINQLKDVDKALMVLYLEGYDQKEIASMLSLSHSNVSTRMNRIKNKLKAQFKKELYDIR